MLSPDNGFEKYMYLGQLLQGEAALAAAQKGVDVLQLVRGSDQHSFVDCRQTLNLHKLLIMRGVCHSEKVATQADA
jgi:hypothetical protein